jgi:uncharacterized protein
VRELAALKRIVNEAKATELDAAQAAWLEGRKQCEGRRAVACLDRLYDARLLELREALVAARQQKNKEPEPD